MATLIGTAGQIAIGRQKCIQDLSKAIEALTKGDDLVAIIHMESALGRIVSYRKGSEHVVKYAEDAVAAEERSR